MKRDVRKRSMSVALLVTMILTVVLAVAAGPRKFSPVLDRSWRDPIPWEGPPCYPTTSGTGEAAPLAPLEFRRIRSWRRTRSTTSTMTRG